MQICVDFSKKTGKIKPFHAVNNAPLYGLNNKLFHYLADAGVPYSRLHDTGGSYGGGVYVDIENIFRVFDADENDPASYDFAFTDWLLAELMKVGAEPFFRLGATIENNHKIKAYHIYPPKDNEKWARICAGIINHYNHGWANGFHYNITYWELWNEPDNEPEIADNPMWKGTKEQYFHLYKTASRYLKEKFPYIKVGGYASCGFYAVNKSFVKNANSSPRTGYFVDFFEEFLKFISRPENRCPFDFFSWHSYASSDDNCLYTDYARQMLDRYGFNDTENILNEWNPGIHRRGTEEDACYILEMMLKLHKKPLDMLMYYDGQVHGDYQGLFDPVRHTVFPAYFALHSFGELYALKNEVSSYADTLPILAACDGERGKVLTVNLTETEVPFDLSVNQGWSLTETLVLDGVNGLVGIQSLKAIPPKKIVMLEFEKD